MHGFSAPHWLLGSGSIHHNLFFSLAIGVFTSNRRGGWLPTLAGFTLGAIAGCHAGVPLLGAMQGCCWVPLLGGVHVGCHCWMPLLACHCWVPLLGCHCWVPLWGAMAGCHCWMLATNFGGVHLGCHCWVPCWGAVARCHCWVPLREKIDQTVTPFSAAPFSTLITHTNWLVLSGVYAGIIFPSFFLVMLKREDISRPWNRLYRISCLMWRIGGVERTLISWKTSIQMSKLGMGDGCWNGEFPRHNLFRRIWVDWRMSFCTKISWIMLCVLL